MDVEPEHLFFVVLKGTKNSYETAFIHQPPKVLILFAPTGWSFYRHFRPDWELYREFH